MVAVVPYLFASAYFHFTSTRIAVRAEADLLRGRISSAQALLNWVLWFHPDNPRANLALGKIELAAGNANEAIKRLRRIPEESDLYAAASLQVATTLAFDGQLTLAEEELERYFQRCVPAQAAWDLYFRILYLQSRTRDVISLLERKLNFGTVALSDAKFLLKAEFVPQDPGEGLEVLQEIHRKHPADINAQVALAISLRRRNQASESERLLRSALDREPGHLRARIMLAQWLADQPEIQLAKEVLWQRSGYPALSLTEPIAQDDRFWQLSSRLAERDQEISLALQYIDRALEIRVRDKRYLSQRAQILRRLSDKSAANIAAQLSVEAGQIEQTLYLMSREFENRPIDATDCHEVAELYRRLGRPSRSQVWERLERQLVETQSVNKMLRRTTAQ
ncbi:MAG: tetratricopeptide repeat protein [Planctomycetaceae bacterium]